MGSMVFRDPQALSSALAALGSLNIIEPLVSLSNYYVAGLYTEISPRGGEFGVWTKEGGRAGRKPSGIM